MNEIALDLAKFGLVKTQRRRSNWNTLPLWANQLTALRISVPEETYAEVVIDHGLQVERWSLWDVSYNSNAQRLEKVVGKAKIVYLKLDQISIDDRGNLHSEVEAAVISNCLQLYFLHGVHVEDPKWVLTPAEQLDPVQILHVANVDLRRELMRKVGIEQFLNQLFHRTIDQRDNYTLLEVLLGDNTRSACKYLKMLNPSIGVWHMEGVPNELQTVEEALLWRNNNWFAHADDIT